MGCLTRIWGLGEQTGVSSCSYPLLRLPPATQAFRSILQAPPTSFPPAFLLAAPTWHSLCSGPTCPSAPWEGPAQPGSELVVVLTLSYSHLSSLCRAASRLCRTWKCVYPVAGARPAAGSLLCPSAH